MPSATELLYLWTLPSLKMPHGPRLWVCQPVRIHVHVLCQVWKPAVLKDSLQTLLFKMLLGCGAELLYQICVAAQSSWPALDKDCPSYMSSPALVCLLGCGADWLAKHLFCSCRKGAAWPAQLSPCSSQEVPTCAISWEPLGCLHSTT